MPHSRDRRVVLAAILALFVLAAALPPAPLAEQAKGKASAAKASEHTGTIAIDPCTR